MRPAEIELLEDDLDDFPDLGGLEIGLPIHATREAREEEDDLGFRALYEHPEDILPPSRWPHAA